MRRSDSRSFYLWQTPFLSWVYRTINQKTQGGLPLDWEAFSQPHPKWRVGHLSWQEASQLCWSGEVEPRVFRESPAHDDLMWEAGRPRDKAVSGLALEETAESKKGYQQSGTRWLMGVEVQRREKEMSEWAQGKWLAWILKLQGWGSCPCSTLIYFPWRSSGCSNMQEEGKVVAC